MVKPNLEFGAKKGHLFMVGKWELYPGNSHVVYLCSNKLGWEMKSPTHERRHAPFPYLKITYCAVNKYPPNLSIKLYIFDQTFKKNYLGSLNIKSH